MFEVLTELYISFFYQILFLNFISYDARGNCVLFKKIAFGQHNSNLKYNSIASILFALIILSESALPIL